MRASTQWFRGAGPYASGTEYKISAGRTDTSSSHYPGFRADMSRL
jgi:hypothetical protein